MDTTKIMKLAAVAAALYGVYKYGPQWAKGMALGIAGTAIANRLPVVNEVTKA